MQSFIQKYEKDVIGSLSGFDRSVFRGTLCRLSYPQGMDYCLAFLGALLKDFAKYVLEVTARIMEASLALAAPKSPGRPTVVIWRPWPAPTQPPPWAASRRNCAGPPLGRANGCGP